MKVVKFGVQVGIKRLLEIWVPALALLSIAHWGVYFVELAL